jgi:hypothetical protein
VALETKWCKAFLSSRSRISACAPLSYKILPIC